MARRRFEQLDQRLVMASDWQNLSLPLDVDSSGQVQPLDVLLVINKLNQVGPQDLGVRPAGYSGPLYDTSGNNKIEPLDALLIINALNRNTQPITITAELDEESDLNGNWVVLTDMVTVVGKTLPGASVRISKLINEEMVHLSFAQADSSGNYSIAVNVGEPTTHIRVIAADELGRTAKTERIINWGDITTEWNTSLLEVVRESTAPVTSDPEQLIKPPPPLVARYLAMMHGAMFDAVNAIEGSHEGYAYTASASNGGSLEAAAAIAAYDVVKSFYSTDAQMAIWDKTLQECLNSVADGTDKDIGIAVGEAAAQAMLDRRANDGADTQVSYVPGTDAGDWNPTFPSFLPATLPQWPDVTPFAMTSGDQFRPAAPPALSSPEYAAAVDEVMRLGKVDSTERTEDQTAIAKFWADGGGTVTPPGHWNSIAVEIGLNRNLSLVENARMLALLNYALADAGIACWDGKYAYDLWRPIDAIRKADADGNAATTQVSGWTPLLVTPSFPAYASGHSTFSAAAATVLGSIFGTEFVFTSRADLGSTGVWPPSEDVTNLPVRSFDSFMEAAQEAGISRIYGGIHYSFDNAAGLSTGQNVGAWAASRLLQPKA